MYKRCKVALIYHYLEQCRLYWWRVQKKFLCFSASGKWSARSLYSWVHILPKGTDMCAKISFLFKLQLWSASFIEWVLQTAACLCCIYSFCSHFWKYLKALSCTWSTLEPQSEKWQQVFIMNLQNEECCDVPCIVLFFSLFDFPLFPQPSVHLSPDSTVHTVSSLSGITASSVFLSCFLGCKEGFAPGLLQFQLRIESYRKALSYFCSF